MPLGPGRPRPPLGDEEGSRVRRGRAKLTWGKGLAVPAPHGHGAWLHVVRVTVPPTHPPRTPRGSGGGNGCRSGRQCMAVVLADEEGTSGSTRVPAAAAVTTAVNDRQTTPTVPTPTTAASMTAGKVAATAPTMAPNRTPFATTPQAGRAPHPTAQGPSTCSGSFPSAP